MWKVAGDYCPSSRSHAYFTCLMLPLFGSTPTSSSRSLFHRVGASRHVGAEDLFTLMGKADRSSNVLKHSLESTTARCYKIERRGFRARSRWRLVMTVLIIMPWSISQTVSGS